MALLALKGLSNLNLILNLEFSPILNAIPNFDRAYHVTTRSRTILLYGISPPSNTTVISDQLFALPVSFFTATGIIYRLRWRIACMYAERSASSESTHSFTSHQLNSHALHSSCVIDPSGALTLHWALFNCRHGPRDWLGDDDAALDRLETRVDK
ncbi:uncharacterized protein FFMR_08001 [Fusarium fujikuroi]|uniref:Uncharacterized protein n=1 Tax=Fusarium fujikuroi TaxID=5127 RepID=A0A9Q9UBF5_FUSFU|nr:uncharacterized protein FFE2_05680 [Fusarium fujikuroi]SCO31795.1 uncharacterized protein FFNC_02487 [Fusarium fujikuroi]SCO45366.1 uncharacterized protein FFMR_08001 [Fusarium fujikuroi]SCV44959.1 uncharacterized protein FFFS_07114 [Fusarium fujikuroi]VTT70786.1 unnamed protein product [Fusarium fujikuroi]